MRQIWLAIGWFFVGLAFLGIWLPLLPTVPFLLVAAWAFARSSPAARQWLLDHALFGPTLRDWFDHGAISMRGKSMALGGMTLGFVTLLVTTSLPLVVYVAVFGSLAGVGWFIVTRPNEAPLN